MYRIDTLLKQNRKLFHTSDLALLWQIKIPNTLYTAIKRYVQRGILKRIHKGFYSTVEIEKLDPAELGIGYLHNFAYLSAESILQENGVIFQKSDYITLISNVSKKFTVDSSSFLVRKMKDEFLYQSIGLTERDGLKVATLERAVADMLYFNPHFHFDNRKIINWKRVKKIQKEAFSL
jgi:predicted transcriptional regulator of viral defense system